MQSPSTLPLSTRTSVSIPVLSLQACSNDNFDPLSSWQDWGARWGRRTAFLKNLKTQLHELEITYSLPVQPIIIPSNLDDQTFAQNIQLGNAGGSGGTLQGSPFLAAPG